MALTKPELIARLLDLTGVNKSTITGILDALAVEVAAQLQAGEPVTIPGIVKLTPKAKPARTARNPATGATVEIEAKTVVAAKILKPLADQVK